MVCPKCNLSYPETVTRCGCGYDLRPGNHSESNVLICPACGLKSPPDSERCDCGYDFLTGKPGTRFLLATTVRILAAGAAGAAACLLFRVLMDGQRRADVAHTRLAFYVAPLVIGFFASLGAGRIRYWTSGCVLLGTWVANAGAIAMNIWQKGIGGHNLLGIELILIPAFWVPQVFIGAAAAHLADLLKRRFRKSGSG